MPNVFFTALTLTEGVCKRVDEEGFLSGAGTLRDEGLFCGEKGTEVALWKCRMVCRGFGWWRIGWLMLFRVFCLFCFEPLIRVRCDSKRLRELVDQHIWALVVG